MYKGYVVELNAIVNLNIQQQITYAGSNKFNIAMKLNCTYKNQDWGQNEWKQPHNL